MPLRPSCFWEVLSRQELDLVALSCQKRNLGGCVCKDQNTVWIGLEGSLAASRWFLRNTDESEGVHPGFPVTSGPPTELVGLLTTPDLQKWGPVGPVASLVSTVLLHLRSAPQAPGAWRKHFLSIVMEMMETSLPLLPPSPNPPSPSPETWPRARWSPRRSGGSRRRR